MIQDSKYYISGTLKKLAAKNLRAYLTFLGELPVPVIVTDSDQIIRLINTHFLELSCYSAGELLDFPIKKIFQKTSGKQAHPGIRGISGNNFQTRVFENILSGKRGQIVNTRITIRNSKPADSLSLFEFFFQVVKTSGKHIREANDDKLFREILSYAKIGYFEIDSARNKFKASEDTFRLLGINPGRGGITYADFLSLFSRKEDRENIDRGLIGITHSDQVFQTDIKIKKRSKSTSESCIMRFFVKGPGPYAGGNFKGYIQDNTQYKKFEKELIKARDKAEKADRFKSNFLTNLSYEIRTPMNAILGFAELLSMEELTQKQKLDYTKVIRMKGNNLLSLIDDTIELSKFETGSIAINKTEFEIYPMLVELLDAFDARRVQLGKTNILLTLKVPEDQSGVKIFTDPGRLQQLLSNLLSNAIKFTVKGEVEFGYKKSGKFFKFYVKDTGIGIEDEIQDQIFNRFREVEETSSRKYGVTGLNLTISKHIVELLGGKIKVKSELNKGSRFQISIPVESPKRKKSNMNEFEDLTTINWKDRVILIAEDEEINYRFLEAVVQKTQAQILRAKTGKEAVELCKTISKIDLVLMDIKMPEMNGFDATRIIKKSRPALPIIAQTAFAVHEEVLKCEESGCDDIVTKPIDIKLLFRKMSNLLQ